MKKISNEELATLTPKERFKHLSKKEQTYYNLMKSKSGVLYITSKPGLAKSSISREIARIMGYNYFDIRLSTADETDFGMPKLKEIKIGERFYDVHTMTVPEWAIEANDRPTIIHFEELNRCSLNVRNACLGVLLERTIGPKFKFNNNVLMIASGNLGEDDGTDVEEFDAALNNRLIHFKHDLLAPEWIEQYAQYYVHPLIIGFIKNNMEYIYRKDGSDGGVEAKAYATPRSWTFLSDYILETLCESTDDSEKEKEKQKQLDGHFNITEVRECVNEVGHAIVGTAIVKFIKYLNETMTLTIDDILNNFNKVKPRLDEVNRDKKSELLNQLKEFDLKKLKEKQIKNLILFLEEIDEDERVGFLTDIVDKKVDDTMEEPMKTILLAFKNIMQQISNMS